MKRSFWITVIILVSVEFFAFGLRLRGQPDERFTIQQMQATDTGAYSVLGDYEARTKQAHGEIMLYVLILEFAFGGFVAAFLWALYCRDKRLSSLEYRYGWYADEYQRLTKVITSIAPVFKSQQLKLLQLRKDVDSLLQNRSR